MSKKGQALNKNISIVRRFIQQFLATIKRQIISLLRTVFVTRKHQQAGNAGFVLPTVTMVSVVVVLLTTAIMFRSFDRAKNASNVRVNQMVMNSAAPAIDRAKAKLNKLFKDQRLSRATPTETELDNVLVTYKDEYTFGDERNLIVDCYDPSSGLKHQGICSSDKELKTAWEFPIDTDNNGKFDSYTLYGIYYKNPALSGTSFVKRNPVQARAIPMTITSAGGNCPSTAISASLAGVNGWFKDNKSLSLVKGFFVYTVTVPITSTVPNNPTYEKASNSKGFSALEYEQDKIKRSLLNNAVIYQDDLYLTAEDANFKLNGGIFTNGNLLAGSTSGKSISIYQVSSLNSCFYDPDNAKITVVKNIGTIPGANGSTSFDLFAGEGVTPTQTTSLTSARDRFSIAQNLDAGSTDRNGYWELAAAKVPDNPQDPVGGLRVVTGAGIYLRTGDTAPLANINFTAALPTIYDRPLPEPPDNTSPDANTPYLKMRASAVYHYKQADYSQTAPKPIACVSSFYYDDSESTTKNKNQSGLPPWTLPLPVGFDVGDTHPNGLSNNGIVYGPPTKSVSYYEEVLNYQSTLKYDNGHSIDDGLLAGALAATAANQTLTLSQQSTIDAAICALEILDGSTPTNTVIPHGAIFEVKVKDNESLTFSSTVLDLGQLKGKTIGSATPSQEYLIPNSGIIYATRDDALVALVGKNKNAIILTNGSDISRELNYRDAEKGLIVATNLPLYIKGDFNLHTKEEFNTSLNDSWDNFYTRSDRNPNFACRPNDPKLKINGVDSCPTGDKWRSAAVISDSITLLSNNYGSLPPSPAADTTTTYNAILVSGNTANCSLCGLEDYVRFPENWNGKTAKISGIFMQQKKSIYDTSYTPNSTPPIRNWSYDVGILRQSPDLLAQKLIADTSDPPNEYFREVDRDDPWIQNLLCAKDNTNTSYIIDKNQRPSMCQS
ncbi:MAG: hormogonium polysaccharide biosynthesis protein HpsA [Aphanizomenon sp.]